MIIETNTKPNWCPNCNAKDKRIAELEKAIEILSTEERKSTMNKKLLEDIRHELVTLDNMIATDNEKDMTLSSEFFKIDVSKTIKRIDKELEDNNDK